MEFEVESSPEEVAGKREYLIEISLVRNPRTGGTGFVARVKEDGSIEFLRAAIPMFYKSWFLGGKYKLSDGDVIIVKSDDSSHKHSRQSYTLYRVSDGVLEEIASISYKDKTPSFNPPELEEIYANVESEKNKAIATLIKYYKLNRDKIQA